MPNEDEDCKRVQNIIAQKKRWQDLVTQNYSAFKHSVGDRNELELDLNN